MVSINRKSKGRGGRGKRYNRSGEGNEFWSQSKATIILLLILGGLTLWDLEFDSINEMLNKSKASGKEEKKNISLLEVTTPPASEGVVIKKENGEDKVPGDADEGINAGEEKQQLDQASSNPQAEAEENERKRKFNLEHAVPLCEWEPKKDGNYDDTDCNKLLLKRIRGSAPATETPPRRWLFFGDSTIMMLFGSSDLTKRLNDIGTVNSRCQPYYECETKKHEDCSLNEAYGLERLESTAMWKQPNQAIGEGPIEYGLENPGCQDCSGCHSYYTICKSVKDQQFKKPEKDEIDSCLGRIEGPLYGGYLSLDFVRDVEIQTLELHTSQEAIAQFVQKNYNSETALHSIKDRMPGGAPPVCVVSGGNHDMFISGITVSIFTRNVRWWLKLLEPQCSHIIWLNNIAPMKKDDNDLILGKDNPEKATWKSSKEWNDGVVEMLRTKMDPELQSKFSVIDPFESSRKIRTKWLEERTSTEPLWDNRHMPADTDWYYNFGNWFMYLADKL